MNLKRHGYLVTRTTYFDIRSKKRALDQAVYRGDSKNPRIPPFENIMRKDCGE
jgi:hypothetical protein